MSDLEHKAIDRLKMSSEMSLRLYQQPLVITDSGGKDSAVCKALAERAGIPYEVLHNHTTADAPETVYFIRQEAKRMEDGGVRYMIEYPVYKGKRTSMWALIPQKLMPPTRVVRYCCDILKEHGGKGRFIVTGVRWAESVSRAKKRGAYEVLHRDADKRLILLNDNDDRRRMLESCQLKGKRVANPIIDWKDEDVWDFIEAEHIPMNPLYAEGWCRVGCVGCPMAGLAGRKREFNRWPKYRHLYISAFDRMLEERRRRGKLDGSWRAGVTGVDIFHWWMEDGVLPGQIEMDFEEEHSYEDA